MMHRCGCPEPRPRGLASASGPPGQHAGSRSDHLPRYRDVATAATTQTRRRAALADAETPAQMGGRQALAGAARCAALAQVHTPAPGRAVLRRACDCAWSQSPPGAAQRRQPAPGRFLPASAVRTRGQDPDEERERALLPASRRVQPAGDHGPRRGSRKAAELFYYLNPHGIQWIVPLQSARGVQRAVRKLRGDQVCLGFQGHTPGCSHDGSFPVATSSRIEVSPKDFIYADPPYDVQFRQYASDGFDWDAQERLAAWLARHPGPVVASNQATDRILALYLASGSRWTFSTDLASSAAPVTAPRHRRSLRSATSTDPGRSAAAGTPRTSPVARRRRSATRSELAIAAPRCRALARCRLASAMPCSPEMEDARREHRVGAPFGDSFSRDGPECRHRRTR